MSYKAVDLITLYYDRKRNCMTFCMPIECPCYGHSVYSSMLCLLISLITFNNPHMFCEILLLIVTNMLKNILRHI